MAVKLGIHLPGLEVWKGTYVSYSSCMRTLP